MHKLGKKHLFINKFIKVITHSNIFINYDLAVHAPGIIPINGSKSTFDFINYIF